MRPIGFVRSDNFLALPDNRLFAPSEGEEFQVTGQNTHRKDKATGPLTAALTIGVVSAAQGDNL
jgi:hypothetical protein